MTISLTRVDYDEMWQQQNPIPEVTSDPGFSEIRQVVPESLGQGYIQSLQWAGLDLTLYNYQFYEDVQIFNKASDADDSYICEVGFHLSGSRQGYRTGENFIQWGQCHEPNDWTTVTSAHEPILKLDIHLAASANLHQLITDTLKDLPSDVRRRLDNGYDNWLSEINTITPAMRSPLEQILNCPFQGKIKQIYLEGKCLELVALKLEQLKDIDRRTGLTCSLKPDDVDRIHHAKAILIDSLDNPPTLGELARQVSLNDYKLKVGFRQVFGTTVFGYLHQHRMEVARQLLAAQRMNVKEVARTVGYASQSRFATAFRKRFDINPKAYLLSKRSG
ncbi:MAG: AraC family transcriptional regulator [Cyanobacteria bacterium P01_D01_bin.105]